MASPTPDDPFGLRPDPTSIAEMLESVVDARIEQRLRGRTANAFDGVSDTALVHELIARGWAVFLPEVNKRR